MSGEAPAVREALPVYITEAPETEIVPPGYRQTEVGVIPEDWETASLEKLSSFITKGSTPTTYGYRWETEGVLFLRSECVSENGLDLTQSMFISDDAHAVLRRSEVDSGDLLMTITGNVGRVIRLESFSGSANINQHIARIRIVAPKAHANFVLHFLSQPQIRKHYESITTGQAYPQIGLQQVRDTKIHLPSLPEQRAIAIALSDVDALIAALDKLIVKKRAVKTAAMQQLLTGKQRLPGFSEEWSTVELEEIGRFSKGKGIRKDEVVSDGVPCVRYGEIYTLHHDHIKKFHSFIPASVARGSQRIKRGDLLFTGSGETIEEIGKCVAYLGDQEAYAGGDIVICSLARDDAMFLGYLMNHSMIVAQKSSMGQGDAVVHISARNLAKLRFALPPVKEQSAIAAVLSDMDAEISALEARREKTRQVKQGMMQELLTGRTRLV